MSDNTNLRVDRNGPLVTITLYRPDSLNALTRSLLVELGDLLKELADDDAVRVIVLTGAGRAFSSGVDLKDLGDLPIENGRVGDILDIPARRVIDLLTSMPKLAIAKVNGFCFTGALELALACDLIVAADEACFGDTHTKFGLRPSWGMSQRLIRAVGAARARELSYTARVFGGAEAAEWGIAICSVPLVELDATVEELVVQLLQNSSGSLAAYKDLYRRALDVGLDEGLHYESVTDYQIPDTADRVKAFRK